MTDDSALQEGLANTLLLSTQASGDALARTIDSRGAGGDDEADALRRPGERIARYVVLEVLGEGGMGVVYAAYDPELDRKIALKVLSAALIGDARLEARGRMVAEARALARVSHPNVVAVHEVGLSGDEIFVSMELVDGRTLGAWRREEAPRWEAIVAVFVEIARGIAAVHAAGLVHRDVKPDNVLIDRRGRVRVTDFGLARPRAGAPTVLARQDLEVVGSEAAPHLDLTATGTYLGTPAYMSPEQFDGAEVTPRSDQFSFGVSLWECLYAARPFAGATFVELRESVLAGDLRPPPPGAKVPEWLQAIVTRALANDPAQRWPSMSALIEALEAGDPRARRRRTLFFAGSVAALAGALALAYSYDAAKERAALAACRDTAAAIDWSAARRGALEEHFRATEAENVQSTASRVGAALDDYALAWRTAREEACVDVEVHPRPGDDLGARRIECLEEQAAQLEGTVELFLEADTIGVARALRTAQDLPAPSRCADPRYLERLPARPEDPATRERVHTQAKALARLMAAEYMGGFGDGLRDAREVLRDAEAIGYAPLVAAAEYRVGSFLEKLGRYEEATEHILVAYREAAVIGDEEQAGYAANYLSHIEGYQLARYDVGMRWAQIAEVHHRRGGADRTLREAQRLDVLAVMLEMRGDLTASLETHERAIALRRAIADGDKSLGFGLHNYAAVLEAAGQPERAREARIESLAILEAHFGRDNPTTAQARFSLANLERDLGNFDAAEAALRETMGIFAASLGEDHPDYGDAINSLGRLRVLQGRPAEAIEQHARALAIHTAALGGDHPDVGQSAFYLAEAQRDAGQGEAATASLRQAIAVLEGAKGAEEDRLARARCLLGEILLEGGELDAAAAAFAAATEALAATERGMPNWRARVAIGAAWAEGRRDPQARAASVAAIEALVRREIGGAVREEGDDDGLSPRSLALAELALADLLQETSLERARTYADAAKARIADMPEYALLYTRIGAFVEALHDRR
ncbi:MAG: serine/threonine-protein kinase [Nannocystaceae bacterium]